MNFSLSENTFTNQFHMIWAATFYIVPFNVIHTIKRCGYESAMITKIQMKKEHCITKEQFDIEYEITNDEQKDESEKEKERNDLSLGEDLETFIERIKFGEISRNYKQRENKHSHLLCLLDKKQRKKLDKKDKDFLDTFEDGDNADVPKAEWTKTEFKHLKFSKSMCYRETYIDTELQIEPEASTGQESNNLFDFFSNFFGPF